MDAKTVQEKIINGQLTEKELAALLAVKPARSGNFMKSLLKGFIEGYTVPTLWKIITESILIFSIIIGTIILSYTDKLDATVTAALLSGVLGFLFGKMR